MLNMVLIFALGVIAGVFVAFGLDILRHFYYRPKLVFGDDLSEESSKYGCHSIVIKNKGRGMAKRAIGMITIIDFSSNDILPDSRIKRSKDLVVNTEKFGIGNNESEVLYIHEDSYREIINEPINWSAVDNIRDEIDIHPGSTRLLDVCRFIKIKGYHQIQIPSRFGWKHLLVVLKPRNYHIKIGITAIDTKMKYEKYSILYSDNALQLVKGWI